MSKVVLPLYLYLVSLILSPFFLRLMPVKKETINISQHSSSFFVYQIHPQYFETFQISTILVIARILTLTGLRNNPFPSRNPILLPVDHYLSFVNVLFGKQYLCQRNKTTGNRVSFEIDYLFSPFLQYEVPYTKPRCTPEKLKGLF